MVKANRILLGTPCIFTLFFVFVCKVEAAIPLCPTLALTIPYVNRPPAVSGIGGVLTGPRDQVGVNAYADMALRVVTLNDDPLKGQPEDIFDQQSLRAFHHVVIFRDGKGLPHSVQEASPLYLPGTFYFPLSIQQIRKIKDLVLDRLYGRYQSQGPERSEEIQNYRPEDREYSDRTINFIWLQESPTETRRDSDAVTKVIRPVGHFQVQVSERPEERINTERHMKKDFIRFSGERWGDFGRLLLERGRDLPKEAAHLLQSRAGGRGHVVQMLKTVLSWFLYEYKGDRGIFQVNSPMLSLLKSLLPKDSLPSPAPVSIGRHSEAEWIVVLNRSQLEHIDQRLSLMDFLAFLRETQKVASVQENHGRFSSAHFSTRAFERTGYQRVLNPIFRSLGNTIQTSLYDSDTTDWFIPGLDQLNLLERIVTGQLGQDSPR